ncbi:hypothetical protein Plhal304r1_c034g0106421 [Plasmopara halstedii]
MRLCGVASAFLSTLILIAHIDASTNLNVSVTDVQNISLPGDQIGNFTQSVSGPPSGDEERTSANSAIRKVDLFVEKLITFQVALRAKINRFLAKLKLAWWRLRNVDPNVTFNKLNLHEADNDILSLDNFHTWVKLVESYNLQHPAEQVSILSKLQEQFGEFEVSIMLEQAKNGADKYTEDIALELQHEQISRWRDDNLSLTALYKALQFGKSEPSLLTGPALRVWNIYTSNIESAETSLFDYLYQTIEDAHLSSLLIAAKQSPETVELATKIQNQLRQKWLEILVPPNLVFQHYKLDTNPTHLLDRPETKLWVRYQKMYWGKTKKEVTLKEMIEDFYKADEIAIIIKSATTDYGKHLAKKLVPA